MAIAATNSLSSLTLQSLSHPKKLSRSLPPLSLHYTGKRRSLIFLVLWMNQMILTKSPRLKPVSTFSPNPFLLLFQIQKNSLFFKTLGNTKTLLLFHLFLVQGSQHILQLCMLIKYVESCPPGDSVVIMFTLAPPFFIPFFKKNGFLIGVGFHFC